MRPACIVRRLTSDDTTRFRQLNAVFGEAFADPDTYGGEPPSDDYLRGLLATDHVIALVALVDDTVVGGLVAYVLDKFERARREVYIYDLAVSEPYRRQGIATSLIEHLREIAATLGAWVLYVQADYGDDPAIALYTKLGVREDVMHFDIAVTRPGDRANSLSRSGVDLTEFTTEQRRITETHGGNHPTAVSRAADVARFAGRAYVRQSAALRASPLFFVAP